MVTRNSMKKSRLQKQCLKIESFFLEKIIFVDGKLLIRYHHFEVGFNFFLV